MNVNVVIVDMVKITSVQKWSYTNRVDFSSTFYIMQQCVYLCST